MALENKSITTRFKYVTEEKAGGATFTPQKLAAFVAREIASSLVVTNGATIRVLDPAVGEGSLLLSLLEELEARGISNLEVHGFDTNAQSLHIANESIQCGFPLVSTHFRASDFLEYAGQYASPSSLFEDEPPKKRFDIIIANPPYVRTQTMGAAHAQSLAERFGLDGRVDLYHAFILGMIEVLEDNGIAGIIVSNRFMTTKSGAAVRKVLRDTVRVEHVWDLGDTKLFNAAVLPAVVLLRKGESGEKVSPRFTSVYETKDQGESSAHDVISVLTESGRVSIADGRCFQVTQGSLDLNCAAEGVWRLTTETTDAWLKTVENHTWRAFGGIGSVRVGIKTCADKIFIRSDWSGLGDHQKPELLRPLTTHHIGRRFKPEKAISERHVLYPHLLNNGQRETANLGLYPKSAAYLETHRAVLERRSYVLEAGRKWYEIWVPQDPAAWELPKLVFRDICEIPTFWVDLDGTVVNGDCYWLALDPPMDNGILWLALAVANSSFIEAFYDHRFHNKLYAGRRRFITQYVECFPLPDPVREESRLLASLAREIYDRTPAPEIKEIESRLDSLVWQTFGLNHPKKSAGSGI